MNFGRYFAAFLQSHAKRPDTTPNTRSKPKPTVNCEQIQSLFVPLFHLPRMNGVHNGMHKDIIIYTSLPSLCISKYTLSLMWQDKTKDKTVVVGSLPARPHTTKTKRWNLDSRTITKSEISLILRL
jgi:hypothetical protein